MNVDAVLKEIEQAAQTRFWPIIGPAKGKLLADTVRKLQPKRVLEVGTLVGYSAILMARNLPVGGQIVAIEINSESAALAVANIRKAGLGDKIDVRIGDARRVIPKLDETFDMIFLDAAKDQYFDYLKLAEKKLKTDGVVFADNVRSLAYDMHGYLKYVRDSGAYRSEYINVGYDGVEISVKLV